MRKTVQVVRDMDRWRQLISEYDQLRQLRACTPQSRGQRFNNLIAELLQCWGVQATANVRAAGEIDVAFAIDGVRFVLEAKWEKARTDTGRIAKLEKRVRQRLSGTYGVFLSMSGYSQEALADIAHGDRLEVLLLDAGHWEAMLGGLVPPQELVNLVRDRASFQGAPYTPLAQLFASSEVPDLSFEPPSEMPDGPLLAAVDGVEAQVVLSGIESSQLGIACYGQSRLLVTTTRGVLDVDIEAQTAEMAVPVPDCRRNVLVIGDGSIVFLRRSGVGRFHDGQITTIGGGLSGNCCLCQHPDGSVWVFDNGGSHDLSASVTRLEGGLGRQQRHKIDYHSANAFTSVWLSADALLTSGNAGYLISSPTTGSKSRHSDSQSNPMGLIALDETAFLTVGGNVSLRRTEIATWTGRELARLVLKPSVTELALAANGDLYLAAYHDTPDDRLSFAVIRVRLPSEVGGLELGADATTPVVAARSTCDTQAGEDHGLPASGDRLRVQKETAHRVGDDVDIRWSGPLAPLPKRMNAVLRLFDAPLYRDWLLWFMLAWAAIDFVSVLTYGPPGGLPRWLTAVIGAVFFAMVCGIVPAWIRLLVRRRRHNHRQRATKAK
ncbi:restriction endonuclease [Amycolatopsis panacis]|uniref:restriction endonuclease n=1 Tax=Amycolatopsis panacis TaxID=2340917 RepID=UPI001F18A41C|nr:restriction endonuclease [Amycolatopsis panacis]